MVSIGHSPSAAPAATSLRIGQIVTVIDAKGIRCLVQVTNALDMEHPMIVLYRSQQFYGQPRCHDLDRFCVGNSPPIPYDEAVFMRLLP